MVFGKIQNKFKKKIVSEKRKKIFNLRKYEKALKCDNEVLNLILKTSKD